MADYGDFKDLKPDAAESISNMPPRDPSLDDFEKLESFCIQDKPDSDNQFNHNLMGSDHDFRSHSPLGSEQRNSHILDDDFFKPIKPYQEEDLGSFLPPSGGNDPFTELSSYKESRDNIPKATPIEPKEYDVKPATASLLDFDIPETPVMPETVPCSADDEFAVEAGLPSLEKLVHPQQAPSSVHGPNLVDETALGYEKSVDKTIVPTAPEIEHKISTADSLVKGQVLRRSPSPVETVLQEEIPIFEAAVSHSKVPQTSNKMSNDEVSSTKDQAPLGCPFSPSALFDPKRLHPSVKDLMYWQDPKKSGGVFASLLLLLLSLRFFSFISVVSYLALGALSVTLSFRIYKNILQAVQKSNDGHPFKEYLEFDLNVSQEKVHETADTLVKHVNCTLQKLRSLFLVEDLVDSIKLGIVLWTLTYVGAWFNGLTLIILGVVAAFTLPKVYESNQAVIDQYLSLAGTQVLSVLNVVKSKIPFGKKEKSQ